MTPLIPGSGPTIFALASGSGRAGLAVVRVSGPRAGAALELLSGNKPQPRRASVRRLSWEGMVLAPTPGTLSMREAVFYALSRPVSTIIVGCDTIAQLEENVSYAREFTPLSDNQVTQLVARAEPVAKPSLFFRFYDRP